MGKVRRSKPLRIQALYYKEGCKFSFLISPLNYKLGFYLELANKKLIFF